MNSADLNEIVSKTLADKISVNKLTLLLSTDETISADEQGILHLLIHFATDRDLRRDDPAYDEYLRSQLTAVLAKYNH